MDGNITEKAEAPLNQILFLQAEITHLYMKKHNLAPRQFLELDKKYDILGFLETGYEPFHLTGPQGVLDELESYIAEQQTDRSVPNPAKPAACEVTQQFPPDSDRHVMPSVSG